MRLILASLCLVLTASPVMSADWEYVTMDMHEKQYYIDKDSMRVTGDTMRVWIKSQHPNSESYQLNLTAFECPIGTIRAVERYTVKSGNYEKGESDGGASYVLPGTVEASIEKRVCKK